MIGPDHQQAPHTIKNQEALLPSSTNLANKHNSTVRKPFFLPQLMNQDHQMALNVCTMYYIELWLCNITLYLRLNIRHQVLR